LRLLAVHDAGGGAVLPFEEHARVQQHVKREDLHVLVTLTAVEGRTRSGNRKAHRIVELRQPVNKANVNPSARITALTCIMRVTGTPRDFEN
jgi:hypothetical protein